MKDEADRLEANNRSLQDRFNSVQADATKLMRERNAIAAEVSDLKHRLETIERHEESKQFSSKSESRLLVLQQQLDEARDEINQKFQDTAQYRQMKTLMQNQTIKIRDLRWM
jgi:predicted nuclease with TOPRIM domain